MGFSIVRPPPFPVQSKSFTINNINSSNSSSCTVLCSSSSSSNQTPSSDPDSSEEQKIPSPPPPPPAAGVKDSKRTKAESTDWIASSLTRRFGLGAGLGWAGFLAAGVISEQVKTRLEINQEVSNTRDVEKEEEVILPNGINIQEVRPIKTSRYYELKVGGGAKPMTGDLVVINLKGRILNDEAYFVDTFETKKPLALVTGSKPYTRGMCEGLEYVLRSMKSGGKRRVIVPPSLGFGEEGAILGSIRIPPSSTIEYIVQLDRVSIAPA
ncbi:Peptidyl-prolyl cis-trans isomerase FKBP17-2, chloroplastic [Linum grandiflorum]